jgi:hypothetical protein
MDKMYLYINKILESPQPTEPGAKDGLTFKGRLVGIAIAKHFRWADLNPAFPTRQTLAAETGLSLSSVDRGKEELVELGWLTWQRRFDSSNLYVPSIPESRHTDDIDTPGVTQTLPKKKSKKAGSVREKVPSVTVTQPMRHTDSSLESHRLTNYEVNNELNYETNNEEVKPSQPPFDTNSEASPLLQTDGPSFATSEADGPGAPLAVNPPEGAAGLKVRPKRLEDWEPVDQSIIKQDMKWKRMTYEQAANELWDIRTNPDHVANAVW